VGAHLASETAREKPLACNLVGFSCTWDVLASGMLKVYLDVHRVHLRYVYTHIYTWVSSKPSLTSGKTCAR